MNDDFFDDFEDDFGDDGDSFSDDPDDGFEMDDSLDDDTGIEDKFTDDLCDDEFTSKEAVIFGMAMNFAYEEGLEEAERRKLEKKMDDDRDKRNNRS
ncbi:MAG: hypothetical protein E4H16_01140 [Candidatus Atribacteria bacterium]|nr:MAG: hypothetical protein E4H16_01140 [Candidatus Atribacteria bacterium]